MLLDVVNLKVYTLQRVLLMFLIESCLECHSQPAIPAPEPIPTHHRLGNETKSVFYSGNWE